MLRWFAIHEYINPHSGLEIIQRATRIVKYKAYLITKTLKLHKDLNTLFYNHGQKVLNCVFHWQLCCYPVIFPSICLQPKSKYLYIDSGGACLPEKKVEHLKVCPLSCLGLRIIVTLYDLFKTQFLQLLITKLWYPHNEHQQNTAEIIFGAPWRDLSAQITKINYLVSIRIILTNLHPD